jgi:putative transposase
MPRTARRSLGGLIYHVLNRANSRRRLFFSDKDYLAFFKVLIEAHERFPVEILALCIMPNHWHLILRPRRDGQLSAFMRWLTQTHTQRWRHAKHTVGYGALYQGRYKSFIVQDDEHLLIVCRYVERNAKRAKLVDRAADWRWGSAWIRVQGDEKLGALLSDWPVDRPRDWNELLDRPQSPREEEVVRTSIKRNRPLGEAKWVKRMAEKLGLDHTLRSPGRPRKKRTKT